MKYKWKPILAAALASFCLFSSPLTALATDNTVSTIEDEMVHNTEGAAKEGTEEPQSGETETQSGDTAQADEEPGWPSGPSIVAESGIVMEVSTGTILYSKNMHAQYYPASITKIMTALLAMENCELDEQVTIPHEAVYMEDKGSHIALDEGEVLSVEDCLYGMMLASANDAAYALAIHIGGTIEKFAEMMNERARELGCEDSNFVNPHGLPDERHVSSAYDMALITREALKHEIFRTVSKTVYYEIQPTDKQPDLIPMSNHHKMICSGKYHYDGVFAGKTGYTVVAKNTLVTCAGRDDMELICVTMKTEGRQVYVDTASLFDFCFDNFKKVDIGSTGAQGEEIEVSVREGDSPEKTEKIPFQISEDGYVILPSKADFSDLRPVLLLNAERGPEVTSAVLEYLLGTRTVGQAAIALPESMLVKPEPETVQDETESAQEPEDKAKGSGFHWWYIPLGILGAAAVACAGFLVVRRQIWKYRWRKNRKRRRSGRR
ncbi:D-alanyl-D-alanine carboxypeptidase family protein [Eisenbergiella sp.]